MDRRLGMKPMIINVPKERPLDDQMPNIPSHRPPSSLPFYTDCKVVVRMRLKEIAPKSDTSRGYYLP